MFLHNALTALCSFTSYSQRRNLTPLNAYNICNEGGGYMPQPPIYYTQPRQKSRGNCGPTTDTQTTTVFLTTSVQTLIKELNAKLIDAYDSLEVFVTERNDLDAKEIQDLIDSAMSKNTLFLNTSIKSLVNNLESSIDQILTKNEIDDLSAVSTAFNTLNTAVTANITALAGEADADLLAAVRDLANGTLSELLALNAAATTSINTAIATNDQQAKDEVNELIIAFEQDLFRLLALSTRTLGADINGILDDNLVTATANASSNIEELKAKVTTLLKEFETKTTRALTEYSGLLGSHNKRNPIYPTYC